ncbi:hypothetical protein SS50377_25989 [Spironucleus salmonicida]|uniref:Uncharacterized protein n=1 Tax=Spironucleus salmonicida TaxID=348837 RepID=V6LFB9_9EUKA|nr:hypothetical protein SS50377_25989 [Spironucleus salmonicida]|eukprot:EST43225.1 Hypothetical protein SS50377_17090 [Spironucleus salmonicida]
MLAEKFRAAKQECARLQQIVDKQSVQIAMIKANYSKHKDGKLAGSFHYPIGDEDDFGDEYDENSQNQYVLQEQNYPQPFEFVELSTRYYIDRSWNTIFQYGDTSLIQYSTVEK